MKKMVGVHQNNFMPWAGYFHKMVRCQAFVFLDNVAITTGSARSITNRTRIKTSSGPHWLSIPIRKSGEKLISGIEMDMSQKWKEKHLNTLYFNYKKAAYFEEIYSLVEGIYAFEGTGLSEFNLNAIAELSKYIGIDTPTYKASEMELKSSEANERLLEICRQLSGDQYFSGRGAVKYMSMDVFEKNGIDVVFTQFTDGERRQLHGGFTPGLSVIDLLFNMGKESIDYIR